MSRILLCNGDEDALTSIARRLDETGHAVAGTCQTSDETLEQARTLAPDLVMSEIDIPGTADNIEVLQTIQNDLGIPVIFVTADTRKTSIKRAKKINPYGYIIMPCKNADLTAAIEVALSRITNEKKQMSQNLQTAKGVLVGSESKAMLLDGFFSDFILYLYTTDVKKESMFRYSIEDAIHNGEAVLYAYYTPCIGSRFLPHMGTGQLRRYHLRKKGEAGLEAVVRTCCDSISRSHDYIALKFLFDFSEFESFDEILRIKQYILEKRDSAFPISGIFAFDIEEITEEQTKQLSEGMGRIVISSGEETTLSFTNSAYSPESFDVVPHPLMDEVVKKSLEAIVLSYLWEGNTGSEILHRIHDHFNVLLPQSTVYSLLYDLEERGVITSEMQGKKRLYSPTPEGRDYIQKKLYEIQVIHRHIFWGLLREITEEGDQNPSMHVKGVG